ncbi:MAG: ABC transporter ATP-binding protein, partial [bacterium]
LDEPFADLDHNGIKEFALILQEIIKRGKSYIILSSNLSNLFSLVRRVIILKDGRLMWDGKLSEIPYSRREIRELGIVV